MQLYPGETGYEVVAALLNLETGSSDVMSTHHRVAAAAAPAPEHSTRAKAWHFELKKQKHDERVTTYMS